MEEPDGDLHLTPVPAPPALGPAERQALLGVVFESLRRSVGGAPFGLPCAPRSRSEILLHPARVFVTLYVGGSLRGCIGLVRATRLLWQAAAEMAHAAATRDPRFDRLTAEELRAVHVDVSVLGELVEVPARARDELVESLQPGVHGAFLQRGDASGLLLPQVARSQGWNAAEFLAQTAIKAGLGEDMWRDLSCELFLFRVLVIEGDYTGLTDDQECDVE